MGYRHSIGVMDKSVHDKIKGLSYRELVKHYDKDYREDMPDEDLYVSDNDMIKDLYELGKYVETDYLMPFKSKVFDQESVDKKFNNDTEFYIISQDGFKAIIEDYEKRILNYFKKLQSGEQSVQDYLKDKVSKWEGKWNYKQYNLDLDRETIVNSWLYEYTIFELVRIYKSIDWDKQLVVITAG